MLVNTVVKKLWMSEFASIHENTWFGWIHTGANHNLIKKRSNLQSSSKLHKLRDQHAITDLEFKIKIIKIVLCHYLKNTHARYST